MIGREFLYELIKQISKISGSIGEALADLESVNLIREKNQSEYLEYIFKHALTQEVAYEGLLKKERRGLHLKVGQAIESLLQHRAGELVETLAYHYQRAGDIDKAVFYCIAAGQRAFDRNVLQESESHFESAYDLLMSVERTADQDRLLVELLVKWCDCLAYDLKVVKGAALLDKHWETAEQVGDPDLMVLYKSERLMPYFVDFEFEKSITLGNEVIAQARQLGNLEAESRALMYNTFSLCNMGRVRESLECGHLAVKAAEASSDSGYLPHFMLAFTQVLAGEWSELDDHLLWMEQKAATGFTRYKSYASLIRALRCGYLMDHEGSLVESNAGLALPYEPMEGSYLLGLRTGALLTTMRYEEALENARFHAEYHRERPADYCESTIRLSLAGVSISQGELTRGMDGVIAGVRYQIDHGQRIWQVFGSNMLVDMYMQIAEGQGEPPPLMTILRNPGFIFRHAIPAVRHARRHMEVSRVAVAKYGFHGLDAMVHYNAARIASHTGQEQEAKRKLDDCIAVIRAAGVETLPNQVTDLAEKIGM